MHSKLMNNSYSQKLEKALKSDWFIVLISLIAVYSWACGKMAFASWTLFMIASFIVLTQRNLMTLLPILCLFSFSISVDTFVGNLIHLVPPIIFVVALLVRMVFHRSITGKKLVFGKYTKSVFLLNISWALGGVYWRTQDPEMAISAMFAIFGIGLAYSILTLSLDNDAESFDTVRPTEYLARVMLAAGMVVCAEVIICAANATALHPEMSIPQLFAQYGKGIMFVGWGTSNNLAAVLTLSIPLTMYLATKKGRIVPMLLLTLLQGIVLIVTMSRASILATAIIFPIALVLCITRSDNKKTTLITLGVMAVVFIVGVIVKMDAIKEMLSSMIRIKMNDNGRFNLYREATDVFASNPFFGRGFDYKWGYGYSSDGHNYNTNTPHYFHNTVFEVLGCLGLFGMLAYTINYLKRLDILTDNKSKHNVFPLLAFLCFEGANMLDTNCFQLALLLITIIMIVIVSKQNDVAQTDAPLVTEYVDISGGETSCEN